MRPDSVRPPCDPRGRRKDKEMTKIKATVQRHESLDWAVTFGIVAAVMSVIKIILGV